RGLPVDAGDRIDQVRGIQLVAAAVALVTARAGRAADRARPLDVAVGQGATGRRGDRAGGGPLHHVAVVPHGDEHVLHHLVVVAGGGAGEQVVGQPQRDQVLDDQPVVAVGELLGGDALGVRGDQDRCAVLVGAGDHEHVVPGHAHVTGEDVGGHAETGDVADVAGTVGVRPGDRGQGCAHRARKRVGEGRGG